MSGWVIEKFPDRFVPKAVLLFLLPVLPLSLPANGAEVSGEILVRHLHIRGNSSFSDDDLQSVMKTREGEPFDDVYFRSDLQTTIPEFYAERGYFRAGIVDSREQLVDDDGTAKYDLEIIIFEDQPALINSLTIRGVSALRWLRSNRG